MNVPAVPLPAASARSGPPPSAERATVTLRPGPPPRWFAATPFVTRGLGSRWPVTNVVEGVCIPHQARADACWAPRTPGVELVTWTPPGDRVAGAPTPEDAPPPREAAIDAPTLAQEGDAPRAESPHEICTVKESGTDVLRVCDLYGSHGPPNGLRIERIDETGTATHEKTFMWRSERDTSPDRAVLPLGLLAFHGTCDGKRSVETLCVRNVGGSYEELRTPRLVPPRAMARAPLAASGKADVVAWIPEENQAFTLVLVREGRAVSFTREEALRIDAEVVARVGVELSARYRSCSLAAVSGSVLRYLCDWQGSAAAIELDVTTKSVRVEAAPGASGVAQFGLRVDENGRVLESADAWRTWHEVEGPPVRPTPGARPVCHSMGCRLGDFVRLGWGR